MANPSILIDEVIEALSSLIEPFVDSASIVRGQVNRVAMPTSPCVVLTELLQVDLEVAYNDYDPEAETPSLIISGPKRIDIQVDIYGEQAGDYCTTFKTIFRSSWAFDNSPENIKPLYVSDGTQAPLTSGEEQYVNRWTLTASMQYNPKVTLDQQFADELIVNVVDPIDVWLP